MSFSQLLVRAALDESQDLFTNSVIHRGMEGYAQYSTNDLDNLKANMLEVLDVVRAA